jgi:anthranilate synthase/aminodeoxychorismate synthase-like glutamine amidotransferase
MTTLLMVDNYDSFTHNLVQAFGALGCTVRVVRNDAPELAGDDIVSGVDGVVLSPGPGVPARAGAMPDLLRRLARRRPELPALGVCLGHQAMAEAVGAALCLVEPVHGEARPVLHAGEGLLAGLPSPFPAGRYHSWAVAPRPPGPARVTARADDGTVMALTFADLAWEGLQFHPESVLTPHGPTILRAFVGRCSS